MTESRLQNRRLVRADLRARRARPSSLPLVVRIETSTECRLACPPCYKPQEMGRKRVMPPRLWSAITNELFPVVDVIELGFDGEALHDPALAERLVRWPEWGPRIDLVTSGDGLGPLLFRLLPRLRRLVISLEVVDPVDYARARPGATWPALQRALEDLRRAQVGTTISTPLEFALTAYRGTVERLPELVHRLARERPRRITLSEGYALHPSAAHQAVSWRDPVCRMALMRAARQARLDGVWLSVRAGGGDMAPVRGSLLPLTTRAPAHWPWTRATVDVDGIVSVCCPPRLAAVPFGGRVGDVSFRDAWAAPSLAELRSGGRVLGCCAICPRWRGGVATPTSSDAAP